MSETKDGAIGGNVTILPWRVHTPNLLGEILNNPGTGILQKPLSIFLSILEAVAERASEINDPQLNALMCRLTLYDIADPKSDIYDAEATLRVMRDGQEARRRKNE